jgi:hypothetical protein
MHSACPEALSSHCARLEGWGGPMVRDAAHHVTEPWDRSETARLLTMRPGETASTFIAN